MDAKRKKGAFGANFVLIPPRGNVIRGDKHHAVPMAKAMLVKTDKKEVSKYPVAVS